MGSSTSRTNSAQQSLLPVELLAYNPQHRYKGQLLSGLFRTDERYGTDRDINHIPTIKEEIEAHEQALQRFESMQKHKSIGFHTRHLALWKEHLQKVQNYFHPQRSAFMAKSAPVDQLSPELLPQWLRLLVYKSKILEDKPAREKLLAGFMHHKKVLQSMKAFAKAVKKSYLSLDAMNIDDIFLYFAKSDGTDGDRCYSWETSSRPESRSAPPSSRL